MQALASPSACCSPCEDQPTTQIPGPQGDPGADGTNGTDGQNAFADLTANFTVPDAGSPTDAEVANSDWAVIGQKVFLEGAGYFTVTDVPDPTHVTLDNTDYAGNVADGTVIASGSHLGPGGIKGVDGTNGTGDMLGSNNLSELTNVATARTNLGGSVTGQAIFVVASPGAIRFLRINADNTVTLLSDSDMRTALSLAIGTNVQAFDADLTAIAALVSAADKVPYATGAGTWALFTATSVGRSLMGQATAADVLTALGKVLPRYGLLGSSAAVNLNTPNNDNSIAIAATTYRIDKVVVVGLANAAAATAGVFTAAGGGGTTLALDQALAAVNASGKFMDLVLEAVVGTDVQTASPLRFRTGTAAGGAATANVFIFGWDLS